MEGLVSRELLGGIEAPDFVSKQPQRDETAKSEKQKSHPRGMALLLAVMD
jgi:hypothetical protein